MLIFISMKRYLFPLAVFILLMTSAVLSANHSYRAARETLISDLNQALTYTLHQPDLVVSQDTIRAYRQLRRSAGRDVWLAVTDERLNRRLRHSALKQHTYLTFDVVDDDYREANIDRHLITSRPIMIEHRSTGEHLVFRSYAYCSFATILAQSDQRMTGWLTSAAFLWLLGSLFYLRRQSCFQPAVGYGGLFFDVNQRRFLDSEQQLIHLTPMQQQLMEMFFAAPDYTLSKDVICSTLWPKKEDANETLYTLIRRLKPIIEERSQLRITVDRGRSYRLEIR